MRSAGSGTDQPPPFWPVWVLLFLAAATWCATCERASAQDVLPELPTVDLANPCAPQVPEGARRALVPYGGVTGVWFHPAVAECLLGRLTVLERTHPLYVDRVRLLDQRIAAQGRIVSTLTQAEELSRQIAETATGALEAAVRGRRQAEEELGAWYRSPVLWTGVGGVIVAAIAVAIRYAVAPW